MHNVLRILAPLGSLALALHGLRKTAFLVYSQASESCMTFTVLAANNFKMKGRC
jgi:hypothetical protein